MPNQFLNEMELDNLIKEKDDRDLLEFTARSAYKSSLLLANHENRINKLESRSKKELGITGGIGTIIGGAVITIINWLTGRG